MSIRKYNSHLLCISSLAYLLSGVIMLKENLFLSVLLLVVTTFSILHHKNFRSLKLQILDWVFGAVLVVCVLYLKFNPLIFILLTTLILFRIIDHIIFRAKNYRVFGRVHAFWHFFSALAVLSVLV